MLLDFGSGFRGDSLLYGKLVIGNSAGEAFRPSLCLRFKNLRPRTVFNPYSVQFNVGDIDMHGDNARLYLRGKPRREYHDSVLEAAVTGTVTRPVNSSVDNRREGAAFQQPQDVTLYFVSCLCHSVLLCSYSEFSKHLRN